MRNASQIENRGKFSFQFTSCFADADPMPEVKTYDCFRVGKGRYFVIFISGPEKAIAFTEVILFGKSTSDIWHLVAVPNKGSTFCKMIASQLN